MAIDITEDFKTIARQHRELLEYRQRLFSTRASYLNMNRSLKGLSSMTDQERDEQDAQTQKFFQLTADAVQELELFIEAKEDTDTALHQRGVIEFVNIQFSKLRLFHKELKSFRMKARMEKREMASFTPAVQGQKDSTDSLDSIPKHSFSSLELPEEAIKDNDEEFSERETLAFEQEGDSLMREFTSMLDGVREAEKRILEISRLQVEMETHVLLQATQIDDLHMEAVETSENIKKANQTLTESKKLMSGTRKWVLIFLIVASLALLFLDWFN